MNHPIYIYMYTYTYVYVFIHLVDLINYMGMLSIHARIRDWQFLLRGNLPFRAIFLAKEICLEFLYQLVWATNEVHYK